MDYQAEVRKVMDDPTASYWLKEALTSAMRRDVLDAARDARFLANLLDARCAYLLNETVKLS